MEDVTNFVKELAECAGEVSGLQAERDILLVEVERLKEYLEKILNHRFQTGAPTPMTELMAYGKNIRSLARIALAGEA